MRMCFWNHSDPFFVISEFLLSSIELSTSNIMRNKTKFVWFREFCDIESFCQTCGAPIPHFTFILSNAHFDLFSPCSKVAHLESSARKWLYFLCLNRLHIGSSFDMKTLLQIRYGSVMHGIGPSYPMFFFSEYMFFFFVNYLNTCTCQWNLLHLHCLLAFLTSTHFVHSHTRLIDLRLVLIHLSYHCPVHLAHLFVNKQLQNKVLI